QTSDNLLQTEATASSERLFLYIFNAQRIVISSSVVLRFVSVVFLRLDYDSM
ncbi:10771_t:CDS:1, partial [Funneliformis caledonium]